MSIEIVNKIIELEWDSLNNKKMQNKLVNFANAKQKYFKIKILELEQSLPTDLFCLDRARDSHQVWLSINC